MSAAMRLVPQENDNDDVEVNWEDQQRINEFSKLNVRLRAAEERLEELKQEKEALDDLSTELELADEDELVLYRIGESYLHIPHPYAIKRLGRDQADIDDQINKSSSTAEQCEKGMKDLKVVLYAKFGTSINLDE